VGLLRIELDIDADVYPELHAALTSLVSEASRGERLRQLAAAGLVWEKLRIRGHAALHGVAAETVPPAAVPASAPRGAKASSRASAAARPSAAASAATAVPRPAPPARPLPPRPAPSGFVDLAIDAVPEPAAAPWPPVLMDVVEPESYGAAVPVAVALEALASRPVPLAAVPAPAALPVAAATPVPLQTPAVAVPVPAGVPVPVPAAVPMPLPAVMAAETVAAHEAPDDTAPDPEPPVEHRSSTRSRLLRMKEKGLFKNG